VRRRERPRDAAARSQAATARSRPPEPCQLPPEPPQEPPPEAGLAEGQDLVLPLEVDPTLDPTAAVAAASPLGLGDRLELELLAALARPLDPEDLAAAAAALAHEPVEVAVAERHRLLLAVLLVVVAREERRGGTARDERAEYQQRRAGVDARAAVPRALRGARGGLVGRRGGRGRARLGDAELAAAALVDPDARTVEAPGRTGEAAARRELARKRDAGRGVGRTAAIGAVALAAQDATALGAGAWRAGRDRWRSAPAVPCSRRKVGRR
jgi:hypothetical protein